MQWQDTFFPCCCFRCAIISVRRVNKLVGLYIIHLSRCDFWSVGESGAIWDTGNSGQSHTASSWLGRAALFLSCNCTLPSTTALTYNISYSTKHGESMRLCPEFPVSQIAPLSPTWWNTFSKLTERLLEGKIRIKLNFKSARGAK